MSMKAFRFPIFAATVAIGLALGAAPRLVAQGELPGTGGDCEANSCNLDSGNCTTVMNPYNCKETVPGPPGGRGCEDSPCSG